MTISNTYRTLSVLSIDVVVGAVCGAVFFTEVFHQRTEPLPLVALAITVWVVYTLDHLSDAISKRRAGQTWRRSFHYTNRKKLLLFVIAGLVINSIIAWYLPIEILKAGFMLIIPVAAYLLLQHRIQWLKEIMVAILYTGGILVPSAARVTFQFENVMLVVAFMGIACSNLLIFSRYDYAADLAENRNSFVTVWGLDRSALVIRLILAGTILCLLFTGMKLPTFILLTMTFLHWILFASEEYFGRKQLFRFTGDAIFFLPACILLFNS